MAHQQLISYQLELFSQRTMSDIYQYATCKDVFSTKASLEGQVNKAENQGRVFTEDLISKVCSISNLNKAYKQVKRNKGASGIDNVPVGAFSGWFAQEGDELVNQILRGEYLPLPVKPVEIPKAQGGFRRLGIPTVQDRVIQQAITQVLSPIFERGFSSHSYGFRPGRSAHQAVKQVRNYVETGRTIAVDMDLKSFFDAVNHDRLMHRLSNFISDKVLLGLIRRYLQSGILLGGIVSQRLKGTPQGSPLSPLLSNIVLDELDKELERRGHSFVRYADDFIILVRSLEAGDRVKESVCSYLTSKLKLKVNEEKSKVCSVDKATFLGFNILSFGLIGIAKDNVKRLKQKVCAITKRNRGVSFSQVVLELNPVLRGWLNYFRLASCKKLLYHLDAWIRRKLRCFRLKQCKRVITLKRFMKSLGVPTWQSWIFALSGKGWWRKSGCPQAHQAMDLKWFENLGLYNLSANYVLFKN